MLPSGAVRLVFMVRRPSSIAQSLRDTGDKGELAIQLYLLVTGILSWLVYLTHPRGQRAIVSYETLVEEPIATASRALGEQVVGVDPYNLAPSPIFIGNRFARSPGPVSVQRITPRERRATDRLTDFVQWPLRLACWASS
jgi:hypothetical protein